MISASHSVILSAKFTGIETQYKLQLNLSAAKLLNSKNLYFRLNDSFYQSNELHFLKIHDSLKQNKIFHQQLKFMFELGSVIFSAYCHILKVIIIAEKQWIPLVINKLPPLQNKIIG